ncbi:hypothetical protein [Hymenobacter antarcticus]|uniref:Vitamin K-dependent gamma-carboxylase n=1 Tax=Hymenobacter antarcticus TaxID=486270 RepID=A0ABP7QCT3_9BACT
MLTFYCLGAAVMNEFMEHQSWADLGPYLIASDFAAWHLATAQHIVPFLTVSAVLLSGVLVLLCWQRPAAVPRPALLLALACHAVFWASTIFVQWPLESALSEGQFSPDMMTRLLRTDWPRKVLLVVEAPPAVFMAHRVLGAASAEASRELAWR